MFCILKNNEEKELTKKYMDEMMRLYRERLPEPDETETEAEKARERISVFSSEESLCQNDGNCGVLQVEVTTAKGDIPIENAKITVYDEKGENIIRFMKTDINGISPEISLTAPPRSISESPEESMKEKPFSEYRVRVVSDGYYPVLNERVVIFSGIKSIQPVNLIPITEFSDNPQREIVYGGIEEDEE